MVSPRLATYCLVALTAAACHGGGSPSMVSVSDPVAPAGEEGDVVVTLHREGGGGALSIPYATNDLTATAGSDYVNTSGTVTWAADDFADKTISVPLIDDVIVEPSETFAITLGTPSNDGVVDRSNLEVTVTDDDHPGDSFAATSAGRLMHFDRARPGRFCFAVEISGLAATEKLVALDVRPNNGKLYGLTDSAKLYTIDPTTGTAKLASALVADSTDPTSPFTGLSGTAFGIDFNPITDRLRVTSDQGQNLRIDADAGTVITDPAISGQTTGYSAIAHNNNIHPACRTRLYAIDAQGGRFVTQSPDNGTTQGAGGLRLTATATVGFDIYTDAMDKDSAVAGLTVGGDTGMYKIDLGTGEASVVRAKVGPLDPGEVMTSFALGTLPAATPVAQELGELFGATQTAVVSFNRANPEKLCSSAALVGLDPNETVLDLDMQPTGSLYALTKVGTQGRLHRVDPYGGTLTPAVAISVPLNGSSFGTDFSPVGNAPLRIVSDAGQDLLVTDLDTGAATVSPALHGAGTGATGAAYTDSVLGAGTATLYVVDPVTDHLSMLNASTGAMTDVGALGIDVTKLDGLDIDGRNNLGFVASTVGGASQLYTLDLRTGALSRSLGVVGTATPLVGLTRATPEVFYYGVTTDGKLVRFDINDPAHVTVVSDPSLMVPTDLITGLGPNEYLVSVDFDQAPNMYGLTNLGNVYVVNSSIANATKLGELHADPTDTSAPFSMLSGTAFDIDFDPTADVSMRIVSNAGQNLRLSRLSPPMVVTDPALSVTSVVAAAYTNNYVGATSTTLFAIDGASSRLMIESPHGSGSLTPVGPLGATGTLAGFDIGGGNNGVALAAIQLAGETFTRLYRIDLATGAATQVGNGIGGASLRGLGIYIR